MGELSLDFEKAVYITSDLTIEEKLEKLIYYVKHCDNNAPRFWTKSFNVSESSLSKDGDFDKYPSLKLREALLLWRVLQTNGQTLGSWRDRYELLSRFFMHSNEYVSLVAKVESLPCHVIWKIRWKYNIDNMSFESFLRRITPEQIKVIEENIYDLYEKRVIPRVYGFIDIVASFLTTKKILSAPYDFALRNQRKGSWTFNFLWLDWGFNQYPHGPDNDEMIIDENLKKKGQRFFAKKDHKPGDEDFTDYVINPEGKYAWLNLFAKNPFLLRKNVQLGSRVCPEAWYTGIFWAILLLLSPWSCEELVSSSDSISLLSFFRYLIPGFAWLAPAVILSRSIYALLKLFGATGVWSVLTDFFAFLGGLYKSRVKGSLLFRATGFLLKYFFRTIIASVFAAFFIAAIHSGLDFYLECYPVLSVYVALWSLDSLLFLGAIFFVLWGSDMDLWPKKAACILLPLMAIFMAVAVVVPFIYAIAKIFLAFLVNAGALAIFPSVSFLVLVGYIFIYTDREKANKYYELLVNVLIVLTFSYSIQLFAIIASENREIFNIYVLASAIVLFVIMSSLAYFVVRFSPRFSYFYRIMWKYGINQEKLRRSFKKNFYFQALEDNEKYEFLVKFNQLLHIDSIFSSNCSKIAAKINSESLKELMDNNKKIVFGCFYSEQNFLIFAILDGNDYETAVAMYEEYKNEELNRKKKLNKFVEFLMKLSDLVLRVILLNKRQYDRFNNYCPFRIPDKILRW